MSYELRALSCMLCAVRSELYTMRALSDALRSPQAQIDLLAPSLLGRRFKRSSDSLELRRDAATEVSLRRRKYPLAAQCCSPSLARRHPSRRLRLKRRWAADGARA